MLTPRRQVVGTTLSALDPRRRDGVISRSVGASGFSYEEAAAICESAVETIKSRVNRARTRLSKLLSIDSPTDSAQIKLHQPSRSLTCGAARLRTSPI